MLQFALLHTVLFSSNLSIQVNRELIFPEVSSLFFFLSLDIVWSSLILPCYRVYDLSLVPYPLYS